ADDVCTGGDARVERDPADVPAHDLGDHAALVRVARRAEAVHRVGRDVHGGVEAERVVGGAQVVVDRLGDAEHVDAVAPQAVGGREGPLAADRDDAVDAVRVE